MSRSSRAAALVVTLVLGCESDPGIDVGATRKSLAQSKAGAEAQTTTAAQGDEELPPGTVVLKGDEAFEHDVGVVADQKGTSFDEAHAALTYQREFAEYAEDALKRHADKLAAIWVDEFPARSGHIVFVGPVPKEEVPALSGVELKGGGKISMDDQYVRVQQISETMVELGHRVHTVYYDHRTQRIVLKARPDAAGKKVDLETVATKATARLSAISGLRTESAVVSSREIDLGEDAEIVQPNLARGGNWLDAGVTHLCTSGFSVRNQAATLFGVVTAAHCSSSLSQLEEPNGTTFRPLTFQTQNGAFANGDAEWHTTTGTVGEFYGAPSTIYSQNLYRYTNAMVGQTVCAYGRASNTQKCNYTVQSVGACRTFGAPVNGQVCALAITNNPSNVLKGGDSGGPVHYSDTMYGVHAGSTSSETCFTPVQAFQIALGVLVWN